MSEKNDKKDRKLKLITEEAGLQETAQEMARSIARMYEDRDKKALGAKDHLVSQLNVTADKYLTANGVMSALDTVRLVFGEHAMDVDEELSIAKTTANHMSMVAMDMARKAYELDPDHMGSLCEGMYDAEFSKGRATALDMVDELMVLQLCQNVGPNAQDVQDFCFQADAEIEKAREDLRKLCDENDCLDFNEVCGFKPSDPVEDAKRGENCSERK